MPILVVKLVGDDILVCTSGQGYVDIRVFDIDNPYDSITSPLYWTGSSSSLSTTTTTTTLSVSESSSSLSSLSLNDNNINELNQVKYIYAIDIIDIPFTSINVNDKKGEDIILIAVTNIGISIGYLNLSKWKIEKTEVIGLPSRYHPSHACIEFISNIQRVIVSLDSDLYLSSIADSISKKDNIFIDRNKKINVVTAYGKPLKNLTIDDYLVTNIIPLYDHEILLLVKSEHTSIMCARWCKLGINPDQLSVNWEINLNSEKATAVAVNKKAGKQSVIENGVFLANESFIYLCNYTGILCKLSIAEEFGNIVSLHIPTHGMIAAADANDRTYGFKVVTSTLSGNYIMYEFDVPHVKNVWQTAVDEPIVNNDTISKKVSILKVTGACEPHDSLVLPFVPYCESLVEVDYKYKKDIDDDGDISFVLGYNHCYGLQYLKITYENHNHKLNDNLKTRSCDFHSYIDHITGVKSVEILRKGINDSDKPDQYLVTCIDDINIQSMIYKCEEGLCLSIDYKYILDVKDLIHHSSTTLESIPFTFDNERVTAIIISNRIFEQSSILILNSNGVTDINDTAKLSIIDDDTTLFSSLFLDEYILQITQRSLCLLPIKSSIGVGGGNILNTLESLNIGLYVQIYHVVSSDKYIFLLDKGQQVHIIKYNSSTRSFENQGIEKLEYAPAAVSAVFANDMHLIAISSWDRQVVDVYKFRESEPLSLLISMPYAIKDNDNGLGFSAFQHIQLLRTTSTLNKKHMIELNCFCATTDGQIAVYSLYTTDDKKFIIWDHSILKTYNVPGYVKKTKIIRNEDANSALIVNSNECDYLLTIENPEQTLRLQRIIKNEKFSRSQLVPINSFNSKNNNCFAWLETNDNDDTKNDTFLCAGSLKGNSKLYTRKSIPIPGIVCEIEVDEKRSRSLVHWKNDDIRGIAVIDITNLSCIWSHNFNSTDDLYLSNIAIGLRPPVPITKKEAFDFTLTLITKSMTSPTAQVSVFKFNEESSGCNIEPIGCLAVDKGIVNHCFIDSDLLLIADGDNVSIILWEEEGVLDSTTVDFEDKEDSNSVRGPVVIAGRLRNRRYHSSNTKKLSHLGDEATLWKDKKVVVGLVTNCTCPFPNKDIVDIQYISTCERNENYEVFVSILGQGIEILKLGMSSSDRYNISRLRTITMNNVILSNMCIKISERSVNYQRANVLAIERLTGKLVKIEQLLTNDEKKSTNKDGNDNYYTTNLNVTELPTSLTISRLLDISLKANGYDVIFLDDELNLYIF